MRIEKGKLVDYDYFDIKKIVQEIMTQWKKEGRIIIIEEFKRVVAKF